MSTVIATAADVEYFLSKDTLVSFKEFISSTAHQFIWKTHDGGFVRALGDGIAVDPDGNIVGGVVTKIQLDLDGDADFAAGQGIDIVIAGISAGLSQILVEGDRAASALAFWNTVLSGPQRFFAGDLAHGNLFGDFLSIEATGADDIAAIGSDDTFSHRGTPANVFYQGIAVVAGDAFSVSIEGGATGQASLTGGNDTIRMSGQAGTGAAGDAYRSLEETLVIGGSDRIFVSQNGSSNLNDDAPGFAGDVYLNGGELRGGDDYMRNDSDSPGFPGAMAGDAAHNRGILFGGDDILLGRGYMAGDAYESAKQLTGGNDRLIGDEGENHIAGDVLQMTHGTVTGGADDLRGKGGFDELIGDAATDRLISSASLTFTGGDDILRGGDDTDYLIGDLLYITHGTMIGGDDRLIGGTGGDGLWGDFSYPGTVTGVNFKTDLTGGNDVLDGNTGDDFIVGDASHYYQGISVHCGDDTLRGGDGNDTLHGDIETFDPSGPVDVEYGNDLLIGGLGSDQINGGGGFDAASFAIAGGGPVNVLLYVYSGVAHGQNNVGLGDSLSSIEAIIGSIHDDTISGDGGDYRLDGNRGDDTLSVDNDPSVEEGNNTLIGGAGKDTVAGGSGNDSITGNVGADQLAGGGGSDVFFYLLATDSGQSAGKRDTINDFTGGEDLIDLSALDANLINAGDQAFVLDTDGSFSTGEISMSVLGADLLLSFNQDSDADAELTLFLKNVASVSEVDFVF